MAKPKIIKRGQITYLLYDEKVVAGLNGNQWVSYNQYENWNRQGITQFRDEIRTSQEGQYGTPSEMVTLASRCGIRGTSTSRPGDLE